MSITNKVKDEVRRRYNYSCGYCGVSEIFSGAELEIEHFQPKSKGGTDEIENLIYACAKCNRNKSDYWVDESGPDNLKLLHPLQDNLSHHITKNYDSRLIGLTPRGWFHIRWLRLNRPQLVKLRHTMQIRQAREQAYRQTQLLNEQMIHQLHELRQQVDALQTFVEYLLETKD